MVRRRQTEVLNAIDSQNSPKGTAATERCNAKACFGPILDCFGELARAICKYYPT